MTDLGTLGGTSSSANGINDSGQIVGNSTTASGYHAFLYSGSAMTDLGTLGGPLSSATGINNNGQIVGWAYTAGFQMHAFLDSGGAMTDLAPTVPRLASTTTAKLPPFFGTAWRIYSCMAAARCWSSMYRS